MIVDKQKWEDLSCNVSRRYISNNCDNNTKLNYIKDEYHTIFASMSTYYRPTLLIVLNISQPLGVHGTICRSTAGFCHSNLFLSIVIDLYHSKLTLLIKMTWYKKNWTPVDGQNYTIGVPLPNTKKIVIPNKFITAVVLNTAVQLPVTSKIYPARYTPRNPENGKIYY